MYAADNDNGIAKENNIDNDKSIDKDNIYDDSDR